MLSLNKIMLLYLQGLHFKTDYSFYDYIIVGVKYLSVNLKDTAHVPCKNVSLLSKTLHHFFVNDFINNVLLNLVSVSLRLGTSINIFCYDARQMLLSFY